MKNITLYILFFVFLPLTQAQQTDYFEWGKQIEIISSVTEKLLDNYIEEPNVEVLTNEAIKGMLSKTDRYTKFYDEQQMFEQRLERSGKVSGIGISVKDKDNGLSVRYVHDKSPAQKAGLLTGDLITEIDGKKLDGISYKAKLKLLKGKPGTTVKIKVKRSGKILSFTLTREIIEQKAVPVYKMLDRKTGYIKLKRFTSKAYPEVMNALVELKNRGAEKIILDLRGNPGGLLNQAVKVVGLFVPKNSLVTYTKGRFEKFNKTYNTKNDPIDENIPLAVLIDKRSASASEIVSGTLQDYDRAVIVGDTSFGKGLVQRFFPLKYGTYIKITISKYYIPSGRQIQKIDYWHRDKNGKATRYKKDRSKVFYTRNKRKVYEHGGITPDIIVRPDSLHSLVKYLINEDYIFDFNTWYYHKNPGLTGKNLDGEKLIEEFIKYLKNNNIDPKTEAEKYLEKSLEKAKKDHNGELVRQLEKLNRQIDAGDFEKMKTDPLIRKALLKRIKKDLILRYDGLVQYEEFLLEDDPVIQKAVEILQNNAYKKILKK
jgi:carboxyl-terminal processing protease